MLSVFDIRGRCAAKLLGSALALALTSGVASLGGTRSAAAGWFSPPGGTWCALEAIGLNDCSYFSYRQCLATLSGVGGTCQPNLQSPPLPAYYPPPRRGKGKHRAYARRYPPPPPPPYR